MKKMKILLTLFVVSLLAGCGGGSDSPLNVTDMAGTYAFAKITTGGISIVPPGISGSLTIAADNRYTLDVYVGASRITDVGSVSVSDPVITLVSSSGGGISTGTISDGGKKITFTDSSGTLEFTKV